MRTTYVVGSDVGRPPRLTFDRPPRRWPWWIAGGAAAAALAAVGWLRSGADGPAALAPPPPRAAAVLVVSPSASHPVAVEALRAAPARDRPDARAGAATPPPAAAPPAAPPRADLGVPGLPPMALLSPSADGLKLVHANPQSLLIRMGLENGDTVMSIDGTTVHAESDVARLLAPAFTGRPVTAYVLRDGQTLPVPLVLRRKTDTAAPTGTPP